MKLHKGELTARVEPKKGEKPPHVYVLCVDFKAEPVHDYLQLILDFLVVSTELRKLSSEDLVSEHLIPL